MRGPQSGGGPDRPDGSTLPVDDNGDPFAPTQDAIEEALDMSVNPFNELRVRQLESVWRHKISVVPETDGITDRWWDFTTGVTRNGPSAVVPGGESIGTTQAGEYSVGDPALAGAGVEYTGPPEPAAGDDWWTGYTNRLQEGVESDGVGIGVDDTGAYVFFDSSVTGNDDRKVYQENWDNPTDVSNFQNGGFVRLPHLFYNHGFARINWSQKTDTGIEITTLHTFTVEDGSMWGQSDLFWQMEAAGNGEGYIDAAHYKAGQAVRDTRANWEGRDGDTFGTQPTTITTGTPIPIISLRIRAGWESVALAVSNISLALDGDFYSFVTLRPELEGANFTPPGDDITGFNPDSSEYAVLTDNEATGFADIGAVQGGQFVKSEAGGVGNTPDSGSLEAAARDVGLSREDTVTVGVIPNGATTLDGASVEWATAF